MAEPTVFPKMARFQTAEALTERWRELGWSIPCDEAILTSDQDSPLGRPLEVQGRRVGNRWCIHPMEGWDGTPEGGPSAWTVRRWENFGHSGAKLIWGGEAVAVRHEGRANPNQLWMRPETKGQIAQLRERLVRAHRQVTGDDSGLLIGLQLTHSGRFCRPNDNRRLEPRIAYHHPLLDRKFGIRPDDESVVISDDDFRSLMDDFVVASRMARDCGFDFVDLKCCHGYLGHELLGAHTRPGPFGGSFENRTRFIRELIQRVRSELPALGIGVRLSAFDIVPFEDDPGTRQGRQKGVGVPMDYAGLLPYRFGFGVSPDDPEQPDLGETHQFLDMLRSLNVRLVNITCGSPYYNPHIQRPAYCPPSDGYRPPEDPLVGVARQIDAVRQLKSRFPDVALVGTGYTYLQEMLPLVAQATVRAGWADFVGIGRMVLSYPEMPLDCQTRGKLDTRRICRTFSDCTTGPRRGLISGCYPLDEAYKSSEAGETLKELKKADAQ